MGTFWRFLKRGFVLMALLLSFWRAHHSLEQPAIMGSSQVCRLGSLEVGPGRLLHLRGSPYEMGYQHGVLLRSEVRQEIGRLYLSLASQSIPLPFVLQQARLVDRYISPEYREEMRGLAQGAGVSYTDISLLNTWPELVSSPLSQDIVTHVLTTWEKWLPPCPEPAGYLPSALTPQEPLTSPLSPESSFALFGEATKDGSLFHGLRFPPGLSSHDLLLILYEPEVGNAFLSLSRPGMVGVTMGLNEEKVSLAEFALASLDSSLEGTPLSFLLRRAVQYAGDIPQAVSIIASGPRMNGANVVLGDGKVADAQALELSAHLYALFEAQDGYVVRSNHPLDASLARLEVAEERDVEESEERCSIWEEAIRRRYGLMDLDKSLYLITHQCSLQEKRCYPLEDGERVLGVVMAASDLQFWVVVLQPDGKVEEWRVNLLEEMGR